MNEPLSKLKTFMLFGMLTSFAEISVTQFCDKNNEEPWSYHGSINGIRNWSRLFPSCGGNQQSPIRIQEDEVVRDRKLKKLRFNQYKIPIDRADIVNNGHTVMITPRDGVKRGIFIKDSEFTLQQMHFHWGSIERPGSEHTINHIRFPMEIHFVHTNAENLTAVVALLVQTDLGYNDVFTPIIQALPDVMFKDTSTQLLSLLNLNDFLPESPASIYRYIGSLTTPPCTEGVVWSILKKTTHIGLHQLEFFLNLYSVANADRSPECFLSENYRSSFSSRKVAASS